MTSQGGFPSQRSHQNESPEKLTILIHPISQTSWIFMNLVNSHIQSVRTYYPLVNVYSLLLKVAIEIVDFPSYNMVDLSSSLCKRLPGRVFPFKAPWPIFKTSWTSANFCRLGMFPQQTQASNLWGIILYQDIQDIPVGIYQDIIGIYQDI